MSTAPQTRLVGALFLGLVYLALSLAAIGLTRFHGGVAFISIANAVLLARLLTLRRAHWGPSLAVCAVAGAIATCALGLGLLAAVPMVLMNVGEALIAAVVLNWVSSARGAQGSRAPLVWLLTAAGLIAPAISATGGAAVATVFGSDGYGGNWLNWFTGHALGMITFTPIAVYLFRGDARAWFEAAPSAARWEAFVHLTLVTVVSVAVFLRSDLPLLFLPALPIVLMTFRVGRIGAAAALVILSVVGGIFTMLGHGPLELAAPAMGTRIQFLQFYLACTVLLILPVAAELDRRSSLYRRLHDSEARYRLLTENSTDIILNLDTDGRIRFASPSIRQISGFAPGDMIGRNAIDLVHEGDVPQAVEAHRQALQDPGSTKTVEYRAQTASGELRWFETHTRAVVDDDGVVTGVVSAVRDVGHRKRFEEQLEQAARTDKLTGLANRNAFDEKLELLIARAGTDGGGCVALFDLDHFKQINDGHGHAAGDAVLARFAEIARGRMRDNDLIARYGGEEFAVILPGASIEQARLVCDRLRAAVRDAVMQTGGGEVSITVSGGVTRYDAQSVARVVMAGADAALYEAKSGGRDRMAIAA